MIESLINNDRAELTQNANKAAPVVLSTRIRLARNLAGDQSDGYRRSAFCLH